MLLNFIKSRIGTCWHIEIPGAGGFTLCARKLEVDVAQDTTDLSCEPVKPVCKQCLRVWREANNAIEATVSGKGLRA